MPMMTSTGSCFSDKDVDYLNPSHFYGCLDSSSQGTKFLPPCPDGILDLLLTYGTPLKGQHTVIVGSSANLGWPVACLLEREGCQLTVLNIDGSSDLKNFVSTADIIVSAVGESNVITEDMVKPGVVDVVKRYEINMSTINADASDLEIN